MRLRGKLVGQLSPEEVTALVDNRVPESRTLDYKEELPGGREEEKKDFLADVCAFANTAGGVLLYGIQTERDSTGQDIGIPATVVGVDVKNQDKETGRLNSLIQDGLDPSLAAQVILQWLVIPGVDQPVLALGVGHSLLGPHRVKYQRSGRFWRRSESGKYQPDVAELRRMFLEPRSWIREAEEFRRERLECVLARRTFTSLDTDSSLLIHVLPLGRLDGLVSLRIKSTALRDAVRPPGGLGYSWRYNADGFAVYHQGGGAVWSYTQWFRFGGLEGYSAHIVHPRPSDSVRVFAAHPMGKKVVTIVTDAIKAMRETLELDPPYAALLSLHGVRGAYLHEVAQEHCVSIDPIFPPMAVIDEVESSVSEALSPALDMIWQCGGFEGAPSAS